MHSELALNADVECRTEQLRVLVFQDEAALWVVDKYIALPSALLSAVIVAMARSG